MSKKRKSILSILLVIAMIFGTVPGFSLSSNDISNHWAESIVNKWLDIGLVDGYPDGSFRPEKSITRAEFMAMINKAYAFDAESLIDFTDVKDSHWAYKEVQKAVAMGYISGYPDGTVHLEEPVTRAEAAIMLAKANKLIEASQYSSNFTDASVLNSWSKGYIGAIYSAKIMSGYPDGTFMPDAQIKRAEALVALDSSFKSHYKVFDQSGEYGPVGTRQVLMGNVSIDAEAVTLQNMTIKGDLIISEKVGAGDVFLNKVIVEGNMYVRGGGKDSIHINGGSYNSIIVQQTATGQVRIVVTDVNGLEVVVSELAKGEELILEGAFENVVILAENVILKTQGVTQVQNLNISPTAAGTVVTLSETTIIDLVVIESSVDIKGQGTILIAEVKADDVTYEKKPDKLNVDPEFSVVIPPAPTVPTAPVSPPTPPADETPSTVAVSSITLSQSSFQVVEGDVFTLVATVLPVNATDKRITWQSSNDSIASVINGVVTATGEGSVTITATTVDGGRTSSASIVVAAEIIPYSIFGELGTDYLELSASLKMMTVNLRSYQVDEIWAVPIITDSFGFLSTEIFEKATIVPVANNGKFELPIDDLIYDQYVLLLIDSLAAKKDRIQGFLAIENTMSNSDLISIPVHALNKGLKLGVLRRSGGDALSELNIVNAASSFDNLTLNQLLELAETSNALRALRNFYINSHPETGEVYSFSIEHFIDLGPMSVNEKPTFDEGITFAYNGVGFSMRTNMGDTTQKYLHLPGEMANYGPENPITLGNSPDGGTFYSYFTPSIRDQIPQGEFVLKNESGDELGYFDFGMVPFLDAELNPLGYFPRINLMVNQDDVIYKMAVEWFYHDGVSIRKATDEDALKSSILGVYFNHSQSQSIPVELSGEYIYNPSPETMLWYYVDDLNEAQLLLDGFGGEYTEREVLLAAEIQRGRNFLDNLESRFKDAKQYSNFNFVVKLMGGTYTYGWRASDRVVMELQNKLWEDINYYPESFKSLLQAYKNNTEMAPLFYDLMVFTPPDSCKVFVNDIVASNANNIFVYANNEVDIRIEEEEHFKYSYSYLNKNDYVDRTGQFTFNMPQNNVLYVYMIPELTFDEIFVESIDYKQPSMNVKNSTTVSQLLAAVDVVSLPTNGMVYSFKVVDSNNIVCADEALIDDTMSLIIGMDFMGDGQMTMGIHLGIDVVE
ncbi:MAG: S-layer homology domain-containing protein [Clostridia bacterium]|nr:S-layer homology domain-containing protein [Clostridia bacterium]